MAKLQLQDLDVEGKRVLMRVDFNVPLTDSGEVSDDTRIRAALPSIEYVREHGGKLILMSHLGRPGDPTKATNEEERAEILLKNAKLTMDRVAAHLNELVGGGVTKVDEVVGMKAAKAVAAMQPGEIVVLENTRFEPGEKKNDKELAAGLAEFGDVYISDAFGAVHRAHASTEGVAHHFEQRAAGFLIAKELKYFEGIMSNPERPLCAILGGAKVADKIGVLNNLLEFVDTLIIGGGMAYTFLKVQGEEIGDSMLDENGLDIARKVMDKAHERNIELLLPVDSVVANSFSETAETKVASGGVIEPGWMGLDIGPATVTLFSNALRKCCTVIWNGPVGVFEMSPFSNGTSSLAQLLATSEVTSVIGGGDTAAAVAKFGYADRMSHISTGGGASLEMLEGKDLPGLSVLSEV